MATAAKTLDDLRRRTCVEHDLGLTAVYNVMEDGGFEPLRDAHRSLDRAVAAAYGFPAALVGDRTEIVRRLLELNLEIAHGERGYAGPG